MTQQSREYIWEKWKKLTNDEERRERSVEGEGVFSPTGLTGGDALKMKKYRERGKTLSGDSILAGGTICAWNKRSNAAMGLVCATPTAGASGTLPGVVFSIADTMNLNHEQQGAFSLYFRQPLGWSWPITR